MRLYAERDLTKLEKGNTTLAKAKRLELVDIDSGHWPMFSKPTELAELLADVAGR